MSLTQWSLEADPATPGLREWVTLAHALRAARDLADPQALATLAGRCLVERLGAREYRVLKLDPRTGTLFAIDETSHETLFSAAHHGVVERAIETCEPVVRSADDSALRSEIGLWVAPPVVEVAMPLIARGAVRGVMLLAFDGERRFDAAERALIQSLGDVIATGFESAELRAEVRAGRDAREELTRRLEDGADTSAYLLSLAACEIRSPLSSIQAYAETLIETLADPAVPRDRFLGVIHEECQRLNRIVTDILDLSRLETGMRPLRLGTIDLAAAVRDAIEAVRPVTRTRQVEIDVEIDPALVVEADPELIRRFLHGLLANAVQFSPRSGFVRVTARPTDEDWTLAVQDQGPPIAAADLPRAFERFFRARPVDSDSAAPGLGLALARGIVESHGGRIWVESIDPAGARFCARLPQRQVLPARARRLARRLLEHPAVPELLHQAIAGTAALANAGVVSIMTIDPEPGDYVVTATHGAGSEALLGHRTTLRAGVAGAVAATGRSLSVANIETDPRFQKLSHPRYASKSLLCVPVVVWGEVVAVISATEPANGRVFDDLDLQRVTASVATLAARLERIAVDPAGVGMLAALPSDSASAEECVDPVALVRAVARELAMSGAESEMVAYVATLLHAPAANSVRGTPGIAGAPPAVEVVRTADYLARAGDLMLARHEHWDGSGHPLGLAGEEIPRGSRVLAVVSVYASLVGDRAASPQRARAESLRGVREQAGRRFDSAVVDALARVIGVAEEPR